MNKYQDQLVRTDWLSRNLLFLLGIGIPVWLIAGSAWGLFMHLFLGGHLSGWLITGIFWAVCCGFFFCVGAFVLMREIALRVPLPNATGLAQRVDEAAQRQKYSVEQSSPETFLCRPKFGLARMLRCNQ